MIGNTPDLNMRSAVSEDFYPQNIASFLLLTLKKRLKGWADFFGYTSYKNELNVQ